MYIFFRYNRTFLIRGEHSSKGIRFKRNWLIRIGIMATNLEYILVGVSGRPEGLTFVFTTPREDSGTSISGGDGAEILCISPFPGYNLCKKGILLYNIFAIQLRKQFV